MAKYDLTDDEATTYITQAVDFGMTQLVDGNWGMQAEIPKAVFEEALGADAAPGAAADLGPPDLALSNATVHWGYFSKNEAPVLTVADGAEVVVEMATHHACDDWDKMIKDDPGMESVFAWFFFPRPQRDRSERLHAIAAVQEDTQVHPHEARVLPRRHGRRRRRPRAHGPDLRRGGRARRFTESDDPGPAAARQS